MTDDRDKRRGRWQSGDERDRAAEQRLRAERRAATASELDALAVVQVAAPEADSDGAPLDEATEVTSPVALILRELTADEAEVCHELERDAAHPIDPDAPATVKQLVKVIERVNQVKAEERRARRDSADRDLKIAGTKGPPLDRLEALERKMRIVWYVLCLAATSATGSVIAVGKGLYERGSDDGAQRIRLDHFERDNERLRLELRDLRDRLDGYGRRSRNEPLPAWPVTGATVAPKGNP